MAELRRAIRALPSLVIEEGGIVLLLRDGSAYRCYPITDTAAVRIAVEVGALEIILPPADDQPADDEPTKPAPRLRLVPTGPAKPRAK